VNIDGLIEKKFISFFHIARYNMLTYDYLHGTSTQYLGYLFFFVYTSLAFQPFEKNEIVFFPLAGM
jgi:hypothetical protein